MSPMPPISMLCMLLYNVTFYVTIVISCMQRSVFWMGLVVMAIALGVAFLETMVIAVGWIVDTLVELRHAKRAKNTEEIRSVKEDLRKDIAFCLRFPLVIVMFVAGFGLILIPMMIFSWIVYMFGSMRCTASNTRS